MSGYIAQIRERTEAKELRLAGDLAMTRSQWVLRGGIYRGTISEAAQAGYYTIRACENMGKPVSEEERRAAKDFAMFKSCYAHHCIKVGDKKVRPCLPVFYRVK